LNDAVAPLAPSNSMKVLILASSPSNRPLLRLNEEVAVIQKEVANSSYVPYFHPAATPADFLNLLCTQEPDIVHISAHGDEGELELESLLGRSHSIAGDVLTKLFQECNVRIQCVVLNACKSERLAEEISQYVNYVIGMSGNIRDSSAIAFSRGFYQALAQNSSIESAFGRGYLAIATSEHSDDKQFPVLKQRSPILEAPLAQDLADSLGTGRLYLERQTIETRACREILKPGALIRIMGSRHMGKTSLVKHLYVHTQKENYLIASLSFHNTELTVNDLSQLLRRLCVVVGRKLNLPDRTDDYWDDTGCTDDCSSYFEDYLLPSINQPLVLCLDDMDLLFQHTQVANDLFSLFRVWHEEAKNQPIWRNLRLITAYKGVLPKQGFNVSPFANVGEPIELREFTKDEVHQLAQQHGLNLNADSVAQLMALVGGHPYLVQKAFVYLAERHVSVEQFVKFAYQDSDHYRTHLGDLWRDIEDEPPLVEAFRRVVRAPQPIRIEDSQVRNKLHAFGLITLEGFRAAPRNELYLRYFRNFFE
jgi:AAA-like domain/CHAT domain